MEMVSSRLSAERASAPLNWGATELYYDENHNKRKASDQRKDGRLRKGHCRYQYSNENENALLSKSPNSDDFPQKKPKHSKYECDLNGCPKVYESEHDLIEHKKTHTELRRYINSGAGAKGCSSHSGSSAYTALDDCFDSDGVSTTHDLHSSTSVSSSRSSSSPPDFGAQVDTATGDFSSIPPGTPFQSMPFMMDNESFGLSTSPSPIADPIPRSYRVSVAAEAMAPTASFDQNQIEYGAMKDFLPLNESADLDQTSIATSTVLNDRSSPAASSVAGTQNPSTEGNGSSQSGISSKVSDSGNEDNGDEDCSTLKGLINSVLRTDPDVARIAFRDLAGKLECAPPNPNDRFEDSGDLSLLGLLELQDSTPIKNSGAFTTYAPSSSSGSSSSGSQGNFESQGGTGSTFCNGQNPGSGHNNVGRGFSSPQDNHSSGGPMTQQSNGPKSSSAQVSKPYLFRCIHNALEPKTFCVTHETQKKYSTCAGPGWKSIQHLKDHLKSHHTKKTDQLQCNRCQETFKTQDSFKYHEKNVDCLIRCPVCLEEFDRKSTRQTHQEQHMEGNTVSGFMEIDEAMDEKIKENLKCYSDSLKKGKGCSDPAMEKWITKNTAQYMIGRPLKANAKLELGQWYTIFRTLSRREVLEIPFYEFGILPSDLAAERILLINKTLVHATIEAGRLPPSQIPEQTEWYQDVLCEALKLAARTTLVLPTKGLGGQPSDQSATPMSSSYPSSACASGVQPTGHANTDMAPAHMITPYQQDVPQVHSSQVPTRNAHGPGLTALQLFTSEDLQSVTMGTTMSHTAHSETTSGPTTVMEDEVSELVWDYAPNVQPNMTAAMGQSFDPSFQFDLPQNNGGYGGYDASESDMLGNPPY